ncbi:unnamed protein product, partial [Rotaria sordida]
EEIREPILCPFCNCECEPVDCEVHQIFCLENPKKIGKRRPISTDGYSNQYSDRLYHDDQSTDTALIRCELCRKSIEWQLFEEHIFILHQQHQNQNVIDILSVSNKDVHTFTDENKCVEYIKTITDKIFLVINGQPSTTFIQAIETN